MIPIEDQLAAVARASVNLSGHINNLRTMVDKRRRPPEELAMATAWWPALDAARETLERVAADPELRARVERRAA